MLRLPVPKLLFCLLLILAATAPAWSAEMGWTLWKGNGIAGSVGARSADGVDRVGLKKMAEVLGCQAAVKGVIDSLRYNLCSSSLETWITKGG